jgi:hypothetical protein
MAHSAYRAKQRSIADPSPCRFRVKAGADRESDIGAFSHGATLGVVQNFPTRAFGVSKLSKPGPFNHRAGRSQSPSGAANRPFPWRISVVYETEGHRFESCRARSFSRHLCPQTGRKREPCRDGLRSRNARFAGVTPSRTIARRPWTRAARRARALCAVALVVLVDCVRRPPGAPESARLG